MEKAISIQIVTELKAFVVTMGNNNLMLLHVKGNSKNEWPGIPFLNLNSENADSNNGLAEFDFMVTPSSTLEIKENIEWEINTVYNLDELPKNLKAIKISAEFNADITMLERR